MKQFHTVRRVNHGARAMYDLVADVEAYPQFLPLCENLRVRHRETVGPCEILTADMTVAYQFVRETFTSRVTLDEKSLKILVEYLDGPFQKLENRWLFLDVDDGVSNVDFFLTYEFRSLPLQLLMGAMFDKAFARFSQAFIDRADMVYGRNQSVHSV